MPLLSQDDVRRYALAHGKVFEYMCDEVNCGKLIPVGHIFVTLKWKKRTDGLTFLGRIPSRVRCMECENLIHPPKQLDIKVANSGRGAKKVTREIASKLSINDAVRKAALSILKKEPALTNALLQGKLRKRKAVKELKKSEITSTLRALKKLKVLKYRAQTWSIPVEKLKKVKNKSKKLKKPVAKR